MKKFLIIPALVLILALSACSAQQSTPTTVPETTAAATQAAATQAATQAAPAEIAAPAAQANDSITVDKAKNIALSDAGLSEADVVMTKAALETDDGVEKYEIKFKNGGYEYDYDIDPKTGNILEKNKEIDD